MTWPESADWLEVGFLAMAAIDFFRNGDGKRPPAESSSRLFHFGFGVPAGETSCPGICLFFLSFHEHERSLRDAIAAAVTAARQMGPGQRKKYIERKHKLEVQHHLQTMPLANTVPFDWATAAHRRGAAAAAAAGLDSPDKAVLLQAHKGSARQLPVDGNNQDAFAMMKSLSIPPDSTQTLNEFLDVHPLVRTVRPFGSQLSIQVMTDNGMFLFLAVMAEISKQHSENISWDGTFSIADILIVKYEHSIKMKIKKEPLKVEGRARQLQARVNDLRRASAIFIPLYAENGVLPVFLDKFKEDLEEATPMLVEKKWFMEYLTYHVAIMPTTGRRYFETMLISENYSILRLIVISKPPAYLNDWKTIVQSTKGGSITLLHDVYYHDNPCTPERPDKYESSVRGLIRFIRNLLEHGKGHVQVAHNSELELYVAFIFPGFLPGLMRSLLQRGIMKNFEDVWSSFKAFKYCGWDPHSI